MPQMTMTTEHTAGPLCTREQAREMLEGLRDAYQSLSFAERGLVKIVIGQAERAQALLEIE